MQRLRNWRPLLTSYLNETMLKDFERGANDCIVWTLGGIYAMTGDDTELNRCKGKYHSLASGLALLRKEGYSTMEEYFRSLFEEVPLSAAQPGDVVIVKVNGEDTVGLFQGEACYVLSPAGMGILPRHMASAALRVPFEGE